MIRINLSKQIKSKQIILFTTLLIVFCILLSGCYEKAEEKIVYKVGIISGLNAFITLADGFKEGMTELGYIEGENIIYDFHKLNCDPEGEKQVIKKFVEDDVDLIFAFPTEAAIVAKETTSGTGIPVVFAVAGIESSNLIESIVKPGVHITGVRFPGPDLTVKRFEFLLEIVPNITRLYIPYDPTYPNAFPALEALIPVASSSGVTLVEEPVTSLEEVQAALQARSELDYIGIDAIQILPETFTQSPEVWSLIRKFSEDNNLPLVGSSGPSVEDGAIFSYAAIPFEMGKLAAPLADQIFKGTPAGEIMVVTPPSYLRINYKKAQELNLTVPESLLNLAQEVIH
ncbi:ABC transporter substrate-binding protein [Candidatus Woesearchaeota archaeon]|nr:ABC transporter substrate-binding protein [Candidatus Woesearchaeota archaeon]